ncbi:Uncharacterised protein [uncultured archaeon]|nr:Uncharacterised protein [uncultured archaeon]
MATSILRKIPRWLGKAAITYIALIFAIKVAEELKLSSLRPLELNRAVQVIEEEKQKLGITNKVDVYTYEEFNFKREKAYGFSCKTLEGYLIAARSNSLNRQLIKYELYHLCSGDLENELYSQIPSKDLIEGIAEYCRAESSTNKSKNTSNKNEVQVNNAQIFGKAIKLAKYWLVEEPRAGLYGLSGIKL